MTRKRTKRILFWLALGLMALAFMPLNSDFGLPAEPYAIAAFVAALVLAASFAFLDAASSTSDQQGFKRAQRFAITLALNAAGIIGVVILFMVARLGIDALIRS